jgi:CheY-like chemotaxis protein
MNAHEKDPGLAQATEETVHDRARPQTVSLPAENAAQAARWYFWQTLSGRVPAIFWSTDAELHIRSSQGSGLPALGLQPGQLVGVSLYDYLGTRDPSFPPLAAHHRALLGQPASLDCRWQGRSYVGLIEPVCDQSGAVAGCQGGALDLTPCAWGEAGLHGGPDQADQGQRLAVVGRVACGILHDINNLLTPVLGFSDLLLARLHPGDALCEGLHEIKKAGQRASALADRFLAFSRNQPAVPVLIDLNAAVADLARLFRRLLGKDSELILDLHPGPCPLRADPCQLDQVLLNLVTNGRDAMPAGGRLTLQTRHVTLHEASGGVRPGPFVLLSLADTGCGMDAATQARIYEPFFTTKGARGTGLGLATVHDIVRAAGGHMEVQSEPGGGTIFRVYWPRADRGPAHDRQATGLAGPPAQLTILLAEKNAAVRTLIRTITTDAGYAVLEAASAAEATHAASRPQGQIDLLIADVALLDECGPELAERLLLAQPGLNVLILSGQGEEALSRCWPGPVTFLSKPFTLTALMVKIAELLGGARA